MTQTSIVMVLCWSTINMPYIASIFLGMVLFLLTSLLCWVIGGLLLLFPVYSVLFLPFGLLGIVLVADAIHQGLLA